MEKTIDNILNTYTDSGRIKYHEIGDNESFKKRYKWYKEYLAREFPEMSFEEIIKFHKIFHKFKDKIYAFNGFDIALIILEKEIENEKI